MKVVLTRFGYTVLAVSCSLLVGTTVGIKSPGLGALVFILGSVVGVILVSKKKRTNVTSANTVNTTRDVVRPSARAKTRYAEPVIPSGIKATPRPIGSVQFVGVEESVEVHGYHIRGPVWVGPLTSKEIEHEPAIIDRKQSIDECSLVEPLGYWPNYSLLNCAQRNRYLNWLASGRAEIDDIGYAFMYFYGLERYVVRCGNEERTQKEKRLSEIKKEVERLRQLFSTNKSFDLYSAQLLDLIYILHWPARIDERKTEFPAIKPLAAHYVIAKQANEDGGEVLDSDWALQWLLGFGGVSRTKTLREQYPVLRLLFKAYYLKATDGGIKVPKCKTKLRIKASLATKGLDDLCEIHTPEAWCDPTGLKRPLTQLIEIHDAVMPSLRALAKAIAKNDIAAILAAWPAGVSILAVPKLKQIVDRVDKFLKHSPSNALEDVARLINLSIRDSASLSQLKTLSSSLEVCGYVLVPDPTLTPATVKVGEHVLAYAGNRLAELSPEGQKVALTIQLGALLAVTVGTIRGSEGESLSRLIDAHPNNSERAYLEHYRTWRTSHPPSYIGVKKHIESLSAAQKEEVAQFIIDLTLADVNPPQTESKQIEKVFKQLGLGESAVTRIFQVDSTNGLVSDNARVEIVHNEGVHLDVNVIQLHEASTREIQQVLGSIFSDDDEPEITTEPIDVKNQKNRVWHHGRLDKNHDALAAWLLGKCEWKMADIQIKCSALGILADGALDTINNVSFDLYGDSLLDVGDPVEVYKDILPA